jgi:hypothetical protein
VNAALADSVTTEPDLFWYRNNGITVLCDGVSSSRRAGTEYVTLTNAQVINGQQTAVTLERVSRHAASRPKLRRARVLVRVIRVPPSGPTGTLTYDEFVSSVVKASNWQNRIAASDLVANAKRQVELERQLRPFGFEYLRKQGTKALARAQSRVVRGRYVTKFQMAQAVAACNGMAVMRIGQEPLFEDPLYGEVFPSNDPYYYLPRYWVADVAEGYVRGSGERRSLKWPVVTFMWQDVGRQVQRHADRVHAGMSTREGSRLAPEMRRMVAKVEATAYALYKANKSQPSKRHRVRGSEGSSVDPADTYDLTGRFRVIAIDDFFKRPHVYVSRQLLSPQEALNAAWASRANAKRRREYATARTTLLALLDQPVAE